MVVVMGLDEYAGRGVISPTEKERLATYKSASWSNFLPSSFLFTYA